MGVDSSRTILMLKEGRMWRWQGEPEIQDLKEEIEVGSSNEVLMWYICVIEWCV